VKVYVIVCTNDDYYEGGTLLGPVVVCSTEEKALEKKKVLIQAHDYARIMRVDVDGESVY
jgi:hypothetical protein